MPKTVHLIRHGQSTFNLAFAETRVDPMHIDARLTPKGHQQVAALRQVLREHRYDLVVSSPLTRAIETALGLFGDRHDVTIEAEHRELLAASCDVGRCRTELKAEFGQLRFDHLPEIWWHDGERDHAGIPVEPAAVFEARLAQFRLWLRRRPEEHIAVIGHGTFFQRLTGGRHLDNCEMLAWRP